MLEGAEAARVLEILKEDSARCYEHYEEMLNARADGSAVDEDRLGLARDLLARHQGQEIDKTDGFLLLFDRPVEAVRYALAYHDALAALSTEEHRLPGP